MKKTAYCNPFADIVLLSQIDVISTSEITALADDAEGLPSVNWKA